MQCHGVRCSRMSMTWTSFLKPLQERSPNRGLLNTLPSLSLLPPYRLSIHLTTLLSPSTPTTVSTFSSSFPLVAFTPSPLLNPAPAYSWPGFSPSNSLLTAIGWLPRKRFRMSIMPRLQSPYPRLSCWHRVGSVSTRGGRRQSDGWLRWMRTHSEDCRQSARAAPGEGG